MEYERPEVVDQRRGWNAGQGDRRRESTTTIRRRSQIEAMPVGTVRGDVYSARVFATRGVHRHLNIIGELARYFGRTPPCQSSVCRSEEVVHRTTFPDAHHQKVRGSVRAKGDLWIGADVIDT